MKERFTMSPAALSTMFAIAGSLHFAKPEPFDSIVPSWVPLSARTATLASGAVELLLAGGLAWPRTRKLAGPAAAVFLGAVFPANIDMARQWVPQSTTKAVIALGRLPLQFPLIASAWKAGR